MPAEDLRSDETKYFDAEIARGVARERERCAKLVEQLMETYEMDKPERRLALAIAARAIRRGRLLTEAEKLRNLASAMEADDIDPEVGDLSPVVARLREEADKAERKR
jgi:hypothetical protein